MSLLGFQFASLSRVVAGVAPGPGTLAVTVTVTVTMLRGFSNFEQMFRAKMAKVAPQEVMVAKKIKDGHSEEEVAAYRATFTKFDVDGGGAIDAAELGRLIRVLGSVRLHQSRKKQSELVNYTNTKYLLSLNPTDAEVEMIKTEVDEDGSGEIDFPEFLEIMNCKTLRFVEKKHHNSQYKTEHKRNIGNIHILQTNADY